MLGYPTCARTRMHICIHTYTYTYKELNMPLWPANLRPAPPGLALSDFVLVMLFFAVWVSFSPLVTIVPMLLCVCVCVLCRSSVDDLIVPLVRYVVLVVMRPVCLHPPPDVRLSITCATTVIFLARFCFAAFVCFVFVWAVLLHVHIQCWSSLPWVHHFVTFCLTRSCPLGGTHLAEHGLLQKGHVRQPFSTHPEDLTCGQHGD